MNTTAYRCGFRGCNGTCADEGSSPEAARAKMCEECFYWIDYVKRASRASFAVGRFPYILIADNRLYEVLAEDQAMAGARGFCGDKFVFLVGRIRVISTNVWNGTPVPARFRNVLPNNARLIAPTTLPVKVA